jgi:hypothetical protein
LLRFKRLDKSNIMDILERDAKILKKHNIMDYSLLFCIEKNPNFKEVKGLSRGPSSTSSDDNNESGMMSKDTYLLLFL